MSPHRPLNGTDGKRTARTSAQHDEAGKFADDGAVHIKAVVIGCREFVLGREAVVTRKNVIAQFLTKIEGERARLLRRARRKSTPVDIENINIPVARLFNDLTRNTEARISHRHALRRFGQWPCRIASTLFLRVLDDGQMPKKDIEKLCRKTCHTLSPIISLSSAIFLHTFAAVRHRTRKVICQRTAADDADRKSALFPTG